MRIVAGDQVIEGVQIFAERAWHMDTSRPAMRVQLSGGLSEAQLRALTEQPWELYDGDELVGRHTGYNTVLSHELRMVQVSDAEQEVAAAQKQVADAQAEAGRLRSALDTDMAQLRAADESMEQKIAALVSSNELLEGCIMELAGAVYA